MPKEYLLLVVVVAMLVAKAISQEIVIEPANGRAQTMKHQARAAEVEAAALARQEPCSVLNGEFAKEAALLRNGWAEARALKIEQKRLGRQTTTESGKGTIGGDDAMAGNDDRDGIMMIRLADGA
jgi:predicted outer membrane protein